MLYKKEDFEVEVRLCEDEKLLKQWNHKEPVIEIFNAQRWCCIPVSDATDSRLEFEMKQFDKLKEQYRLAIPHLTVEEFVGEERMATLEEELAETREAFETLKGATVGKMMRELEAAGVDISKTPHELAKERGLVGQWKKEIEAAGGSTQRVIDESELVAHLSGGWRFVAQLNNGSGKIVVER